ncbi:hypothetical protein ACFYT4_16660 [Streptomyces sp. NPDC004609]|uniref:hypothetical protein n=1 Tax=Streptomyces sp. NPDC004609 TaxID=3364704 RepID=UPI0036AAAE39
MLAFDSDPAQEQSEGGWPCDELAYSWAAHRRDRSMWEAFLPVRGHVGALLATATAQLGLLPDSSRDAWTSKINGLDHATTELDHQHDRTVERLGDHLARPHPNLETVDLVLTEFFDEAWPALDVWAAGGHAVIELNTTVHQDAAHSHTPKTALRLVSGGITSPSAPGRPRGGRR